MLTKLRLIKKVGAGVGIKLIVALINSTSRNPSKQRSSILWLVGAGLQRRLILIMMIILIIHSLSSSIATIDTGTLLSPDINSTILISIVSIYIYKYNMDTSALRLENSIVYSKRAFVKRLVEVITIGSGIKLVKDVLKENREIVAQDKINRIEENYKKLESESYKNLIDSQAKDTKITVLESELEELKKNLDSSNRSPKEDDILSTLYDYITQPLEFVSNLTQLQSFALGILLFTIVLISSLFSIIIYMSNTYFLDKYNIKAKYPKLYEFIVIYRKISNIAVLISILIFVVSIILIIVSCCYIIIYG